MSKHLSRSALQAIKNEETSQDRASLTGSLRQPQMFKQKESRSVSNVCPDTATTGETTQQFGRPIDATFLEVDWDL